MTLNPMRYWLVLVAALLLVLAASVAAGGDAQPTSDERCVAQCDDKSDKCMQETNGDEKKQRECDDQYEQCLARCR